MVSGDLERMSLETRPKKADVAGNHILGSGCRG